MGMSESGYGEMVHPLAFKSKFCFSSLQLLSRLGLFAIPWTAAHQSSLSITNSQSLLKLISIESMMPSNHLILCRALLLLPSIFPSIRVFSNESALCIRWPKYWSFSFNISPSNEHSGLISFRMDWLDLLAVQKISFCLTCIEVLKGHAYSHCLRYSGEQKKFGWLAATPEDLW